jgi:hypothetical protein
MPSNDTDRADRRDRDRHTDQALTADRAGRDRLRRRADTQLQPSHGDPPRSSHVPNTSPGGRP